MTMAELLSKPRRTKELECVDPHAIAFATATFYKNWHPISNVTSRDPLDIDGIRGDLALKTLRAAKLNGFQIAVVDGGSSEAFKNALSTTLGQEPSNEKQKGMSPSRRQVFTEASGLAGVKIIAWVEPEKVAMANGNNLQNAALPILKGDADVVIPKRDAFAFLTYPEYQVSWEQQANNDFNKLLKDNGLLPQDAEDLDVWFGPRLFKNDPEVLKLFLHQWERDDTHPNQRDAKMDPEHWAGAIFLPVVAKLYQDKLDGNSPRVISFPVNYTHPEEQTRTEKDSPVFTAKREQQSINILDATAALVQIFTYDAKQKKPLYRPKKI